MTREDILTFLDSIRKPEIYYSRGYRVVHNLTLILVMTKKHNHHYVRRYGFGKNTSMTYQV
jgi:hypothetical protein